MGVLEGSVTVRDIEQKLEEGGSHEATTKAKERAENIMEDWKRMIWCEMVPTLENVLYLRPYKGDSPRAWKVLCEKYRSFQWPRLQCLIEKLTSLRKENSETVGEYVTRAEEYQYELKQEGEEVTEKILTSLKMKGLPKEFNTFVTLVRFSKEQRELTS